MLFIPKCVTDYIDAYNEMTINNRLTISIVRIYPYFEFSRQRRVKK